MSKKPFKLRLFNFRATIQVEIIDDNDYEKKEVFYIELGEPKLGEKDGERIKKIKI